MKMRMTTEEVLCAVERLSHQDNSSAGIVLFRIDRDNCEQSQKVADAEGLEEGLIIQASVVNCGDYCEWHRHPAPDGYGVTAAEAINDLVERALSGDAD